MENVGFPNFLCFAKKDEKIVSLSKKKKDHFPYSHGRASPFLFPCPMAADIPCLSLSLSLVDIFFLEYHNLILLPTKH